MPYDWGMATLGEAWIEVHADTKPFSKELGPKLKAALADVNKDVDASSVRVGQTISKGISEGVDKDSDRIRTSFRKIGKTIEGESKSWSQKLAQPFEKMAKGNFILTRIFGQLVLTVGKVAGAFVGLGQTLFKIGDGLLEVAGGAFEALRAVTGVGGQMAVATTAMASGWARVTAALSAAAAEAVAAAPVLAAMAAMIILVTAAVTALTAALLVAAAPFAGLLQFALALPAALTVLIGVIVPLIVAFKDLDDVMKLVFEKDPKKLEEGMKKLNPVMQGLVTVLRGFSKQFQTFAVSIQKAFFDPIIKALGPALKVLMPPLTAAFTQIAGALGNMVANVLKFLSQRSSVQAISKMMGDIAKFLADNSDTLTLIFEGLLAASEAALPMVLKLIDKFNAFLTSFATWIQGAITDGRFQKWLDDAQKDLDAIWNLVSEILGLFKDLFVSLQSDGRDFLNMITDAIKQFRDWAKSKDGKQALEAMGVLAKVIASAFKEALHTVEKILTVVGKIYGLWKLIWGIQQQSFSANTVLENHHQAQYSGGGVVPEDQIAMVHAGEPILDPANTVERNRSILAEAGMLDVLSAPTSVVNVYLGTERLTEMIDYRVARNNQLQARTLLAGPRG